MNKKTERRGRKSKPVWYMGVLRKDGIVGLAKEFGLDYNTAYRRMKQNIPLDRELWQREDGGGNV